MILFITLGTVIGMNIHRNLLLKLFLCYESFIFIISVIILIWSTIINGIFILLYLLWNSIFEVILGLTILFLIIFILKTNNKFKINITLLLTIIKGYILYYIISINYITFILLINLYSNLILIITIIMKFKFKPLSLFMVIVVILISSIVLYNNINYFSIIDSYLFIYYITLFQLSMMSFILSCDIIITIIYWDLLGLISYLLINFWSSKINHGIKAVLYNKIGDNFFLYLLVSFYSFFSIISYYPELSVQFILPFTIMIITLTFLFIVFNTLILQLFIISLFCILYSKSAQLPFSFSYFSIIIYYSFFILYYLNLYYFWYFL